VGLASPVVGILLLAGLFDGLSGNPVGSVLLVGVGLALARSRVEADADEVVEAAPRSRSVAERCLIAGAIVAYAVVAGAPARVSWPATVAVALAGITVLVIAARSRTRRPVPPPRPVGAAMWAGVLVSIALWELINLLLQPSFTTGSYAHPTLSVLADPILAGGVGRSAAMAVWLTAGWYLVER
jgi:hypothetical protein